MEKRLPPLQSLLAFDATARLGSFTKAAQELALTQSAISHQIQHLEQWVGQALFSRLGRGVKLTSAGELFSQTVASALNTLRDGRERIEPYRNPDSVLLACSADFAAGWLMPRLSQLRARYPRMEVWLITEDELREIDRIDVDLIISTQELGGEQMRSVPLLDDHALAVCGAGSAARLLPLPFPDVLAAAPLIIDEHYPEWAPWLAAQGVATTRAITIDAARLRLDAAQEELGIAMVSRLHAEGALRRGLVHALPQVPTVALPRLWLTRSTLTPRTPAVQLAFDWLCEVGAVAA
ncbi:LysR family transcriptional regulator [Duganella sp. LX20W]|uniref:LysR family transcriptional regulator n=1 Tax=Rugamonas brunnea TaxID=2758569 RepID=A0A7W2IE07_9BURK|nr:LysR substrate-binding domain-containing protein [Rugamonas brunnea]MBA5640106.1 LysR family transcriptional regulator [Rugamonas brunnea]